MTGRLSVSVARRAAAQRRRFTMTQLLTLLQCGWKYRLTYVDRVRTYDYEGELSPARSMGIAKHSLLRDAFERLLAGAGFPDEQTLRALLNSRLPRGLFLTDAEWEAAKREVVAQVKREIAWFDPAERTCLAVEQTCSFAAPEALFTARVDRLDRLASGGLEVIEYKSGREPETHGVQSALLHMLVAWTYQAAPGYRPIRVTLVHLPTGQRDTAMFCREELIQVRLQILRALQHLDADDVAPEPGPHCSWCPFAVPERCPAFGEGHAWDRLDEVV